MFLFFTVWPKIDFAQFQTGLEFAFSPQILPSLYQNAHWIAFFELLILIKNFIRYLLAHAAPQFILFHT